MSNTDILKHSLYQKCSLVTYFLCLFTMRYYSPAAITWQCFCVYFDLVTDQIYRTVQLIQHKGMKEMHLINFVNFALLLPIFLN